MNILLNGKWEIGIERSYTQDIEVPSLALNPCEVTEGTLWYKKEVELPVGEWSYATLKLNGARFSPSVYINGEKVSEQPGGMAPTFHRLTSIDIKPEAKVVIEIELQNLDTIPKDDASKIPAVDVWRSNVSSGIWDDITLHLHGTVRIKRLIPWTDLSGGSLAIVWNLEKCYTNNSVEPLSLNIKILDIDDNVIISKDLDDVENQGRHNINLNSELKLWDVDNPVLYKLKATLSASGEIYDVAEQTLGIRDFKIDKLAFELNNQPVKLRASSVVWHRWLRDPEAEKLAFDTTWFEENIVKKLKDYGANTLRFHLGTPPEKLLDLCDRYGLMVQIEWIFFHGIDSSFESMLEQWRNWLDLCFRHPSVCLIHPWNETESPEDLQRAFKTIEELSKLYPPMVIAHRDVLHLHKYWWSLFENIGLYYDSPKEFEQPCMVDEFGGNYLDGEGNSGAYPMIEESMLRFLGRNHTKEMRLQLHADANAKIAEYWRRLGVAGFSPFCILGSPEDGNHHFLGKLIEANEKPVWKALTAAYAPVSCSMETWDCNYYPGQKASFQLYLFNDTHEEVKVNASVLILDSNNCFHAKVDFSNVILNADSTSKKTIELKVPNIIGDWSFVASIEQTDSRSKHPVISSWAFRTMQPIVPEILKNKRIRVLEDETELLGFCNSCNLNLISDLNDDADLFIGSELTLKRLIYDKEFKSKLNEMIDQGCSILLLDVGPTFLGREYPIEENGLLQKEDFIKDEVIEVEVLDGVKLSFTSFSEPESCIHPFGEVNNLWKNIPDQATSIWNGLRGGLIVPAVNMNLDGLNSKSLLEVWSQRGAEEEGIKGDNYFAHELGGEFAFSMNDSSEVKESLREKVRFLVEDSPSLGISINPNSPIKNYNLSEMYKNAKNSRELKIETLVCCGKNLSRIPVLKISFGKETGRVIVSQLLMNGRLSPGFETECLYGIRNDPAAQQMLLNMASALCEK